MPQILFVGDLSFWDTADQAAQAGFEDLIGARFELELLSPHEACAAARRLMSALSPARRPVFDRDALEAVIQRADGLVSRLFPLVAAIEAIATETNQTRVTTAVIDAAVAKLEGRLDNLASPSAGIRTERMFVYTTPEDGCAETIAATGAFVPFPITPHWEWSVARMSGATAALVGILSLAAYWLAPFGTDRIWAETRTALEDQDARGSVSPETTIIVRLPVSTPLHAGRTSDYDGVLTTHVIAALAAPEDVRSFTIAVPEMGNSIGYRPALRKKTAETRPKPSFFATRPSKGIWLFPPNTNG